MSDTQTQGAESPKLLRSILSKISFNMRPALFYGFWAAAMVFALIQPDRQIVSAYYSSVSAPVTQHDVAQDVPLPPETASQKYERVGSGEAWATITVTKLDNGNYKVEGQAQSASGRYGPNTGSFEFVAPKNGKTISYVEGNGSDAWQIAITLDEQKMDIKETNPWAKSGMNVTFAGNYESDHAQALIASRLAAEADASLRAERKSRIAQLYSEEIKAKFALAAVSVPFVFISAALFMLMIRVILPNRETGASAFSLLYRPLLNQEKLEKFASLTGLIITIGCILRLISFVSLSSLPEISGTPSAWPNIGVLLIGFILGALTWKHKTGGYAYMLAFVFILVLCADVYTKATVGQSAWIMLCSTLVAFSTIRLALVVRNMTSSDIAQPE